MRQVTNYYVGTVTEKFIKRNQRIRYIEEFLTGQKNSS